MRPLHRISSNCFSVAPKTSNSNDELHKNSCHLVRRSAVFLHNHHVRRLSVLRPWPARTNRRRNSARQERETACRERVALMNNGTVFIVRRSFWLFSLFFPSDHAIYLNKTQLGLRWRMRRSRDCGRTRLRSTAATLASALPAFPPCRGERPTCTKRRPVPCKS